MEVATEAKAYLSPDYKLLSFFEKSRNRWKAKALARNVRIKRLENRIAALEASREKWKEKAKQMAQAQRVRMAAGKEPDRQKRGPR